nr:hypothetical protein [Tanacetum cinerariifolium]
DNDSVIRPEHIPPNDFVKVGESVKHVKPIKSVKPVKTSYQAKKSKNFNSSPNVDRKDSHRKMTQKLGLGFGFTKKACFVCGSMSHLIKDYTFHEDRMAKKSVLPNNVGKGTVFTRSERTPVSAAKPKVTASTSAAKPVNTAGPKQSVHFLKSRSTFHKSHSPIRRSFYNTTRRNSTERVNTPGSKAVSAVKGNRVTVAKTSAGNKAYLANYQEINDGGFVAFGSSRGKITGKASIDKSNLWHMWLGHVNFKTMNKLMKINLVRGLPSMIFDNDHTCVACQKGKQHKATCKAKLVSSISQPLQMLHMDLFGPTSVMSINHKKYFLIVTGDFSRHLDEFCGMKGIKREYSNAKTPQQNRVAERKNRTLVEVARTMLADSLLPITFWAEAVNTACYVLNRDLVTKSHNKTHYELLNDRTPRLDFMRPFGCPITILNTLDPLGKFEGKADEGFWLGTLPQDTNGNACTQDNVDVGKEVSDQHYIVFPLWSFISSTFKSSDDKATDDKPKDDTGSKTVEEPVNKEDQAYRDELDMLISQKMKLVMQRMPLNRSLNKDTWIKEELLKLAALTVLILIEAIRIFLAFASFMGFIVSKMDVKSAFLYGTIEEEVYVSQPSGFIDPQFPNKLYKIKKALYGLHQALRAESTLGREDTGILAQTAETLAAALSDSVVLSMLDEETKAKFYVVVPVEEECLTSAS